MNDNTISLLQNINENLSRIVSSMMPQNGDNENGKRSIRHINQGTLGNPSPGTTLGGTVNMDKTARANMAALGKAMSSLDNLPTQVKNIAGIGPLTAKRFKNVMSTLIKTFTDLGVEVKPKSIKASKDLMAALNGLVSLPEAIAKMKKVKEKDIKLFCGSIGKIVKMISESIGDKKINKDKVKTALLLGETINVLVNAIKSLPKMILIAPLAVVGAASMIPVLLVVGAIASLVGLLEKPLLKGSKASVSIRIFVRNMMEVAVMSLVLGVALIGAGMLFITHQKEMLQGMLAMTLTLVMVVGVALFMKRVSLITKRAKPAIRELLTFSFGLILLSAGITLLGIVLKNHLKEMFFGMIGITATLVLMLMVVGMVALVGKINDFVKKSGATASIFELLFEALLLAGFTILLGKLVEEHWDHMLYGIGATAVILLEIWGVSKIAENVGKDAKAGAIALLLCGGVIASAIVIMHMTILMAKELMDFFGDSDVMTLKKKAKALAGVFVGVDVIVLGAAGVARIAQRQRQTLQNGALGLLIAEGVILSSIIVMLATIKLLKVIDNYSGGDFMGVIHKIGALIAIMTGMVLGAGLIAQMASKVQSKIMKGALAMLLIEGLLIGSLFIMKKTLDIGKELDFLVLMKTVGSMILVLGLFAGVAIGLGALMTPPVGFFLTAGLGVMAALELLILGMVLVTKQILSLNELKPSGVDSLGTYISKTLRDMMSAFTYDNLNFPMTTQQILSLNKRYLLMLIPIAGMRMMIHAVGDFIKILGGLTAEDSLILKEKIGVDANGQPIYGNGVNVMDVTRTITTAITLFADELYNAFKGKSLKRMLGIGFTLRTLVKPVNMFVDLLTSMTAGKDGTITKTTIDENGEVHISKPVVIRDVALLIAGAIRDFVSTLVGPDGINEDMMKKMSGDRTFGIFGKSRFERSMGVLGSIVEPVASFIDLITMYESSDGKSLKKIRVDEKGKPIDAGAVQVDLVGKAMSSAINTFVEEIFVRGSWIKTLEKTQSGLGSLFGFKTKEERALGVLGSILTPIASFIDVLSQMEGGTNGTLKRVIIDKDGNTKSIDVPVISISETIATTIDNFVNILFNKDRMKIWRDMIYKSTEDQEESDLQQAIGILSVIINPICTFIDVISKFNGANGSSLTMPIFDKDGKQISTREVNVIDIATAIATAVTNFVDTVFSPDNVTKWLNMIYRDVNGANTNISEDLKSSIGVFAAIIDPVVKFADMVAKFGTDSQGNILIYDGKSSRKVNLGLIATSLATSIGDFITNINTAFNTEAFLDLSGRSAVITEAMTAISAVFDTFGKIGDISKEKLENSNKVTVSVIESFQLIYDTFGEEMMQQRIEKTDLTRLTKDAKEIVTILSVFDGYDFEKSKYKKALSVLEESMMGVKNSIDILGTANIGGLLSPIIDNINGFIKLLNDDDLNKVTVESKIRALIVSETMKSMAGTFKEIYDEINGIDINSITELTTYKGKSVKVFGFSKPFINTGLFLKNFMQTKEGNWLISGFMPGIAPLFNIIKEMSKAAKALGEVDVPNAENADKILNKFLDSAVNMSSKKNVNSVMLMAGAMNSGSASLREFDRTLKKGSEERKKHIDELIDAVNTLNEKLEKTSENMGTVSTKMTEIADKNTAEYRDAINGVNSTSSSNSNTSSSSESGNAEAATGNENAAKNNNGLILDSSALESSIRRALNGIKLDSGTLNTKSDLTAYTTGLNPSDSAVVKAVDSILASLGNLDFEIKVNELIK